MEPEIEDDFDNKNNNIQFSQPQTPQPLQPQPLPASTALVVDKPKKRLKFILIAIVSIIFLVLLSIVVFVLLIPKTTDGSGDKSGSAKLPKSVAGKVPFANDFKNNFAGKLFPEQSYSFYHKYDNKIYKIDINTSKSNKMRVVSAYSFADGPYDFRIVYNHSYDDRYVITDNDIGIMPYNKKEKLSVKNVEYRNFDYKSFEVYCSSFCQAYKPIDDKNAFSLKLISTKSSYNANVDNDAIKGIIDLIQFTASGEPFVGEEAPLMLDNKVIAIDDKILIDLSKLNILSWGRTKEDCNAIKALPKTPIDGFAQENSITFFECLNDDLQDLEYSFEIEEAIVDNLSFKFLKAKDTGIYMPEFYYQVGDVMYKFGYSPASVFSGKELLRDEVVLNIHKLLEAVK